MKKLRPFLPGVVMAAFLLLTDGCASTDPDTVKTRGVYTTLAVEGQSLDLSYSQYVSRKSFGPGQTPAAVVAGYGDEANGINQPQPFTLQLLEAGSGTVLFSKESDVYYGRVATLRSPSAKAATINSNCSSIMSNAMPGTSPSGGKIPGPPIPTPPRPPTPRAFSAPVWNWKVTWMLSINMKTPCRSCF